MAGSFSPAPLPATAYAGQEVIPEEEDKRLLELLRAQVRFGWWDGWGVCVRRGALQPLVNYKAAQHKWYRQANPQPRCTDTRTASRTATPTTAAGQVQGGAAVPPGVCKGGGGAPRAGGGGPSVQAHHAAPGRWGGGVAVTCCALPAARAVPCLLPVPAACNCCLLCIRCAPTAAASGATVAATGSLRAMPVHGAAPAASPATRPPLLHNCPPACLFAHPARCRGDAHAGRRLSDHPQPDGGLGQPCSSSSSQPRSAGLGAGHERGERAATSACWRCQEPAAMRRRLRFPIAPQPLLQMPVPCLPGAQPHTHSHTRVPLPHYS